MWKPIRPILPCALLAAVAFGCEETPTAPDSAAIVDAPRFMGKPGGKPGGGQDITALRVTLASGLEVGDDGDGAYVHQDGEIEARIFTTGNFGLDVRGSVKARGKQPATDRRVCLTLTERGDPGNVLFEGCEDVNLTTNQPDAGHPNGFNDLTDPGDVMTTAMRFLWGNETDTNVWLNAAGVGVGQDVWVRYGSRCWDDAAQEWPEVSAERATATVDGAGWRIVASDAYWCGRFPNANNTPVGPDPDGRVSATVEFQLEPL